MVRENGNAFANAYKYIKEQNEAEANKYHTALVESAKKHQDTLDKIYNIRESREIARKNHNKLLEDCKNDALGTVIKAIYIEALVPGSLTDNALFLAESMVDGWIKEKGGASKIIGSCRNTSYLLNRICSIVEEVAEDDVKEIEADESDGMTVKEKEAAEEEKKAKVTQMLAQANSLIAKATALQNGDESVLDNTNDTDSVDDTESSKEETNNDNEVIDASTPVEEEKDDNLSDPNLGDDTESKEEEKSESDDEEKESSDKEDEKEDESDDKEEESSDKENDEESESDDEEEEEFDSDDDDELTDDEEDEAEEDDEDLSDPDFGDIEYSEEIEDGEDEDQQDAEEELTGESLDDDTVDDDEEEIEDTSVDGENTEPQGKIFDELDKEEDVRKAVQLIRQRVADAEEDFIKRNAEDKKQIDNLLGKISDNIKTVEDLSNDDSTEGQTKTKIAQESTMMLKRKIKNITENRPQSVFERMARKLTEGITKDSDIRAMYLAESGRTDMASVVETTKVMYGFLEALRTLQLEKVDSAYIEKVLKEM